MSLFTLLSGFLILLPIIILAFIKSKTETLNIWLILFFYFLADSYLLILGKQYINLEFIGLKICMD